MKAVPPKGF